jgi:glycosyltransferase involved in cell wall biosynthesis
LGVNLRFIVFNALRPLWVKIPSANRFQFWKALHLVGGSSPLPAAGRRAGESSLGLGPIVVSGFFSDTRGIAQIARLAAEALRIAGFEVIEHDITGILLPGAKLISHPPMAGGVWILCCNPPEAKIVLNRYVALAQAPLFRIGMWAWELQTASASWRKMSEVFHEIWALSAFQADAFADFPTRVRVMPPVVPSGAGLVEKAHSSRFRVLHISDLRSSADRKNPMGAIQAYSLAFPAPGRAQLQVKLSGVEANPETFAALCAAVGDRPDIQLLTDRLSAREMHDLMASCDTVLSLHRAEGLGLPVAEAMARGKAVIITGWSGMAEFFDANDPQLVPYTLTDVRDSAGLYSNGQWAEPDLNIAAHRLVLFAQNAEFRLHAGLRNRHIVEKIGQSWSRPNLSGLDFARYANVL